MRTNGELERDAQVLATFRRIADALDAIAGTISEIHEGLKAPQFSARQDYIFIDDPQPRGTGGPRHE